MSQKEPPLFTRHEHALEKAHGTCPECSSELTIKHSKSGPFIGCVAYPDCSYTRPLVEHDKVEDKVLTGSECPECGHELAVKQGRYGMFIGCTNYPICHHIAHDENVELQIDCPMCQQGHMQKRQSRHGKTFYSCSAYPKCKFVVNFPPIAGQCEVCEFALLIAKKSSNGTTSHVCANKRCGHKQKAS